MISKLHSGAARVTFCCHGWPAGVYLESPAGVVHQRVIIIPAVQRNGVGVVLGVRVLEIYIKKSSFGVLKVHPLKNSLSFSIYSRQNRHVRYF